jgi:hypothetical protein
LSFTSRPDVSLVGVTRGNAAEHTENFRVAVRDAPDAPSQVIITLSGTMEAGWQARATLIVGHNQPSALSVPLGLTTQRREAEGGAARAVVEWRVEIRVTAAMSAECTVDVLIDIPERNVGTVYRVLLSDFLLES